jgi:hypothetical protein
MQLKSKICSPWNKTGMTDWHAVITEKLIIQLSQYQKWRHIVLRSEIPRKSTPCPFSPTYRYWWVSLYSTSLLTVMVWPRESIPSDTGWCCSLQTHCSDCHLCNYIQQQSINPILQNTCLFLKAFTLILVSICFIIFFL